MNGTGMKDRDGTEILLGDIVAIGDLEFEVIINDFSHRIVVDGETGQQPLIEVHEQCVVIGRAF
jgi:DNA phosphorothioation-dependent restriction protein DptG